MDKAIFHVFTGLTGWLLATLLLMVSAATAQVVPVDGISPYFCDQLGGSASGGTCHAPYEPYSGGNACSIYNGIDDKHPPVSSWLNGITASCSAASILDAKKRTLESRARLRGYVSAGYDESVNDPVVNSSYRPEGATLGSGEVYFAVECAIRTCAGGGIPPSVSEAPPDTSSPPSVAGTPPPPTYSPPYRPPAASPPAPPPASGDGLKNYVFKLCNRTGDPVIYAAVIYRHRPEDRLRLRAWYQIEPNKCAEFNIRRDPGDPSALFYYYAESKRGRWDGQGEPLHTTRCLGSDKVDRYVDDPYDCRSSDIKRKFKGVRFKGDHTENLVP